MRSKSVSGTRRFCPGRLRRVTAARTARGTAAIMLAVCALTASQGLAQPDGSAQPVSIEDEPMHHIRLKNGTIRVYEALIPAGASTLYHVHEHSSVGIDMTSGRLGIERVGEATTEKAATAGTLFSSEIEEPYVHRLHNLGDAMARAIVAERAVDVPLGIDGTTVAGIAGYELEFETDLVTAWRLSLAPGASTGVHTLRGATLVVALSGGQLGITQNEITGSIRSMAPGDLDYIAETDRLDVSNRGLTTFVAAVLQWK